MVRTLPPAAITSPFRASWYCTRPVPRRDKNQVVQHRLDALDLGLRALDGRVGLVSLCSRSLNACQGPFVIAAALIESLLGDNLLFDQLLSAFEIGFGRRQGGITLVDERLCLSHRLLGALHVGLRRPKLGFIFRRRYAADDLSRFDFAAFLYGDIDQPARIFRRDVDLCRFDAAIGLYDALRHRICRARGQADCELSTSPARWEPTTLQRRDTDGALGSGTLTAANRNTSRAPARRRINIASVLSKGRERTTM